MELTSRDNPLVKEIGKLLSDAKYRRKSGRFAIEGARLCEDAARSNVTIVAALATPLAAEKYAASWQAVTAVAASVYTVSETIARHLSDTDAPQGIFCLCEAGERTFEVCENGVYLALEDMQDPGNLGTVIRTAEAFGVDGLLLSKGCCDRYNPKVLRASMGGVFRMPMKVCEDLTAELRALNERLPVLACVVDADAEPIMAAPKNGAVAVIGNEGNGLTAAAVAACGRRVTIPMAGRAESLNASMAAGVVLWELCRERGRATV
ncbi:MAG: RNA methyltransferase [Clostridia bacterium]|nr:RNA methyltransferase [Clostridia bacterium]